MSEFYAGDSFGIAVTLKTDGVAVVIPPTAVVTAGLVDRGSRLLVGPISVTENIPESNWLIGKVIVLIDGALTSALMANRGSHIKVWLEVQVEDGNEVKTRRVAEPLKLLKDSLPEA